MFSILAADEACFRCTPEPQVLDELCAWSPKRMVA